MKILYTSDIHVDPFHFDRLFSAVERLSVTSAIIGGDLIPARGWSFAGSIESQRRWISDIMLPKFAFFHRKFPEVSFFMDFGNDDLLAVRRLVEERDKKDFSLIHNQIIPIDDKLAIAGYMCVPPTPFKLKDWEKCDGKDRPGLDGARLGGAKTGTGIEKPYKLKLSHGTIEQDLSLLSQSLEKPQWQNMLFVLVTHSPPRNTSLDCIGDGRHVGSLAIRRFIEHWAPSGRLVASFHGHIHESPWVSGSIYDNIEGVLSFNIGQQPDILRALLFDPDNVEGSAQLVIVEDTDDKEHKLTVEKIGSSPI
jgi:Icc-related predicted phosphoesterase